MLQGFVSGVRETVRLNARILDQAASVIEAFNPAITADEDFGAGRHGQLPWASVGGAQI